MKRRVVVTGLGVISPIGNDTRTFTENLRGGKSGIGPITSFDTRDYRFKKGFEVKNFDPHQHRTHLLDPFIQYAIAATAQAIADSNINPEALDPYRIGISVSSSKGGTRTIERFKDRFFKRPSALLGARIYSNSIPNFAAQWIARRWKVKGPAKCYVAACATGTVATIEGARMVADGIVDYCIAGASDASLVPLMLSGYYNMKALSRAGISPFDAKRQGFLVGEGAGILILESLESAKERNANIYGEISGYQYGNDGTDILSFNHEEAALSRTLSQLVVQNDLDVADIDYINLHGTATRHGDLYETNNIKKTFGKQAYDIPMSSIKGATGHLLGASGAVELVSTLLAMQHNFIPPTVGLKNVDAECDLDYVPNVFREKKIKTAISHSMGFGGHIAAILLKRD